MGTRANMHGCPSLLIRPPRPCSTHLLSRSSLPGSRLLQEEQKAAVSPRPCLLCRAVPWGWVSPAQKAPGHAAYGGQQQGAGDGQHGHEPGWRVPRHLCPCDDQWLLLQHLQRRWGEGTRKDRGILTDPGALSGQQALLTVSWVVVLGGTGVLRGVTCTTSATTVLRRGALGPPRTSTSSTKVRGSGRSSGR